MISDPYQERKKITFAQAEGVEPLPEQLKLKEISEKLRAVLWSIVHDSMEKSLEYSMSGTPYIKEPWLTVLRRKHVLIDHRMSDEFTNKFASLKNEIKSVFMGDYVSVFGFIEWLLRQPEDTIDWRHIETSLVHCRAAYRLLDDHRTLVPISSDTDLATVNTAFADLAGTQFNGATSHLRSATKYLSNGAAADSIRESIHAVESVARVITGKRSLSDALKTINDVHETHPALIKAFLSLYGFTSDEKGIRHPLLDDINAKVDETDAIFMLGACSAFVSFLIARTREMRAIQ